MTSAPSLGRCYGEFSELEERTGDLTTQIEELESDVAEIADIVELTDAISGVSDGADRLADEAHELKQLLDTFDVDSGVDEIDGTVAGTGPAETPDGSTPDTAKTSIRDGGRVLNEGETGRENRESDSTQSS